MTAIATAPSRNAPQINDGYVRVLDEIFNLKNGLLATYNMERENEIDILGDCLISGNDPILLGPPGTGKTHILEMTMACVEGTGLEDYFDILLAKDMSSDDVLGVRSLPAMKDGRVERVMAGMLPTARFAVLDEIFKASPPLQNALLDILARRKFKVGGKVIDVRQLLLIVMASNEYPTREDLAAFKDRIVPVRKVEPVRAPENRKRVMQIQDEFQSGGGWDTTDWPKVTMDDIYAMRAEAMDIIVPDGVFDKLNEAVEKFGQAGYEPSTRRYGQFLKQMKARAYRKGRDHVTPDDLIVVKDMAFNELDQADSAYNILIQFAGKFARKAADLRATMEPLMTSVDQMRADITAAAGDQDKIDTALDGAYKILKDLRRFKRDAKEEIRAGKDAGENTGDLESVLAEIQKAEDYVERVASGAEDE